MTWANGRISERKQGDDIGTVSCDWVVNTEILYTHSKTFSFKVVAERNKFKTEANLAKDKAMARITKQDTYSTQIDTFMNAGA